MKKFFLIAVLLVVAVVIGGYGTMQYKNRKHGPDVYALYKAQDTVPVGKTGVFLIGLSTTEDFDPTWWYNIFAHIAQVRIPWPFRIAALADRGVALMDPNRDYATEEFTPTSLVDRFGRERDMDATPYIARYAQGEVQWVPPRESIHLDTGYFVYTGRQDGVPTTAGKTIGYARLWYWGRGIEGRKIPAARQQQVVNDYAIAQLNEKYPDVLFTQADTMAPYLWRKKIFDMLDAGVETFVLASPMVIYSGYEDFNNGFQHSIEYVHEWEQLNDKQVKVIMTPPMGHFKAMRDGYLLMMKDKLDRLPRGVSVKMVWSVHGMPWRVFQNEPWLEQAPAYRDVLVEESKAVLDGYDFSRFEVVVSQDHFADHYWDPEQLSLATNRAYTEGVADGYDYVLNLPIEFYNENTDTLFYHAMVNYENFPDYTVYDQISYPPTMWDRPYTKHFEIDGTQIDYLGVPVGDRYAPYIGQAMFDSWDSVLAQHAGQAATN
ncbi:MAG: hypothetical protein E2O52_04080 [Gammaproteobacteria bacterium]|nr:MAG: hypothetical protein E2O52_04080 [Gammaproteobacteria bacterium]